MRKTFDHYSRIVSWFVLEDSSPADSIVWKPGSRSWPLKWRRLEISVSFSGFGTWRAPDFYGDSLRSLGPLTVMISRFLHELGVVRAQLDAKKFGLGPVCSERGEDDGSMRHEAEWLWSWQPFLGDSKPHSSEAAHSPPTVTCTRIHGLVRPWRQMRFHMLERGHLSTCSAVNTTKHLACFQAAFQSVATWFKLSRQRIPVAGGKGVRGLKQPVASLCEQNFWFWLVIPLDFCFSDFRTCAPM